MVELFIEHVFLNPIVWWLVTVFLFILVIIFYRKKKYYERIICTLFGDEEVAFEFYQEATELEQQDSKVHNSGEEGQVSEAVKQSKTHAKITKAARKQAETLRTQYRRLESIIKLAQINRSQILNILSQQKIKTGFHH